MEQCAIRHRLRKIERPAAVRPQMRLYREQMPLLVKASLELREKWMPMAGERHVLVTIPAHTHRFAGVIRRERCQRGGRGGLRFLAAETAAHARTLHEDRKSVV